jgi:hypothetical protein
MSFTVINPSETGTIKIILEEGFREKIYKVNSLERYAGPPLNLQSLRAKIRELSSRIIEKTGSGKYIN